MNKSPWSSYGRTAALHDVPPREGVDPTFGAAGEVARAREQSVQYMQRLLREYADIRAGRAGYQRLVAEAMKPSSAPESVEERLRRLGSD